ncbi:hypothetical protein ABFB09_01905 [Dehalogenimonas sp. THU2]
MHAAATRLVPEGFKDKFREIAKEEEWHASVAQEILNYLKRQREINQ